MMPHVDDGTLHALLDGALRAETPEHAAEVEAHLDACADCRARLEAAAELRDAAGRILGRAAPDAKPAIPDFAEVRDRAARSGAAAGGTPRPEAGYGADRSRQLRWTRGLAWAATLVVALGTGYLIRDLGGPAMVGSDDAETTMAAGAEPRGAGGEAERQGRGGALEPMEEVAEEAAPPPAPPQAGASTAQPPARVAADAGEPTADRAAAGDTGAPARKVAADQDRAPGPLLETVEREEVGSAAAPPVGARAAAGEPAPGEMDTRLMAPAAAPLPDRQEGRWVAVTPAEAAGILGGDLYVLPRASLIEVFRADGPERPETLTLQRLASGITIRVIQRPADEAGADRDASQADAADQAAVDSEAAEEDVVPTGEAASLPSASTVTVRKDDFVLEITGSLPAELLVILGESARPAG